MNVSGVTAATNSTAVTKAVKNELDKDAFVKLLLAELKYQDPMEPMKDKDFIAQMAQFSALEQTQNLATSMNGFITQQKNLLEVIYESSMVSQAGTFLGKMVEAKIDGTLVTGRVDAISIENGIPTLSIMGRKVAIVDVTTILADALPSSGDTTDDN
jgi:flagellar basal-body rod modification protein FlgD